MNPDFFKDRFPVRPDSIMTDDSPPMSLNEVHMLERSERQSQQFKRFALGLISILK